MLQLKNISNIKFSSKLFTSKDLFINDYIFIDFNIGPKVFLYLFATKSKSNNLIGTVFNSKDADEISKDKKALSVNIDLLTPKFKKNINDINHFISQYTEREVS